MHAIITCYMLLLYYILVIICSMYKDIFTIGIVLIRGNTFSYTGARANYSYVSINAGNSRTEYLTRCFTGLGPSGNNGNGVLGGLYFKGNRIPNEQSICTSGGSIIQVEPGAGTAGVFNIHQCRQFTTAAEGVYTCILMNSAMMNESVKFGIYFNGRSELLDLYNVSYLIT